MADNRTCEHKDQPFDCYCAANAREQQSRQPVAPAPDPTDYALLLLVRAVERVAVALEAMAKEAVKG